MLVNVLVENFKSFNEETELSMISSSKIHAKKNHRVSYTNINVLKNAVIYGANASGKSNLVDVFALIQSTVRNMLPVEAIRDFCRCHKENETKASKFELRIEIDGLFYAYGFSAILAKNEIVGEWLYRLYQNGSSKLLYKSSINQEPVLGEVTVTEDEMNRFSVYAKDFASNHHQLFLSEMNRNKQYSSNSNLLFFKTVYEWIVNNIVILKPNISINNFEYYDNEQSLKNINNLIRTFDTGITEVYTKEITVDELSRIIPKEFLDTILATLKKQMVDLAAPKVQMTWRTANNLINIQIVGNDEPKISTVEFKHGKSILDFDFDEESDGTQRVFDLIDMLLTSRKDTVYVIDELERSLHPKLTEQLLKLFMEAHQNDKVQLLFTTHEDSIMDLNIFRRDEIWFVERDFDNISSIYSLAKFKERYDTKLSKAYLNGRYGAIPIFSSFHFEDKL